MTAETRCRRWPILKLHAVFAAPSLQGVRVKLCAVVAVEDRWQPGNGPGEVDISLGEPGGFFISSVQQAKSHGRARRRIERKIEARHHSGADIDRDRQDRAPDRPSELFVNHNDVDERVVDLPDFVGAVRHIGSGTRRGSRQCIPLPSPARRKTRLEFIDAPFDRAAVRGSHTFNAAGVMHALHQGTHGRPFLLEPVAVDLLFDQRLRPWGQCVWPRSECQSPVEGGLSCASCGESGQPDETMSSAGCRVPRAPFRPPHA